MTDEIRTLDEIANQEIRRARGYVLDRVNRDQWGPIEAIAYATDRDLVAEFYAVIAFTRLCVDKQEPHHTLAHRATLVRDCVDLGFIDRMAKKFGFSDERTKYLIEQHDQTVRAFEGLSGSGE